MCFYYYFIIIIIIIIITIAHVFDKIHQRASNRICYHPKDANILISGSQDSSMITLVKDKHYVIYMYKKNTPFSGARIIPLIYKSIVTTLVTDDTR